MKRAIVLFIFLAFISSETHAQTYGLDNANPALFSKFRIPETDLSSLWFNTNFSYNSSKNTASDAVTSGKSLGSNLSYSLSPYYYLLKESDDRYLSLSLNAYGNYRHTYYDNQNTGLTEIESRETDEVLDLTLNTTYRGYATPSDIYYSFGSNIKVNLESDYQDVSNSNINDQYSGSKTQNYVFSIGLGWGKIRDVTSVVSAIRFQQRLKQLNLLSKDLSEKTIEDLADQFYKQGYYSQVYVRPDRFFWQDVEKTLSRDGVSLSGLNQYADSYIREVPSELRFMRNEGLIAGLNLQVSYNNVYSSLYPPTNVTSLAERLFAMGNAYLDYSHQLNLNSQLVFNFSLSGGPCLTKSYLIKQEYLLSSVLAYDYELTDRIVTTVTNTFNMDFRNGQSSRDISNSLSAMLYYFVEDDLSLNANYSWQYDNFKWLDYQILNTQNYNSVQVGFTYYIHRGFIL